MGDYFVANGQVFDSVDKANEQAARSYFDSGNTGALEAAGVRYVMRDGKLQKTSVADYEKKLQEGKYNLALDAAIRDKDYASQVKLRSEKLRQLEEEFSRLDPSADQDLILANIRERQKLEQTIGNLKKRGSKGRVGRVRTAKAPKIAKARIKAVTSKSATVKAPTVKAPKITSGVGSTANRRKRGKATRIKV